MIKPEKTRKIPENSEKTPKIFQKILNFWEKSPKNPKNLPARFARRLGGGLPAAKLGGIFQIFFLGGYFGYTPLGHACTILYVMLCMCDQWQYHLWKYL